MKIKQKICLLRWGDSTREGYFLLEEVHANVEEECLSRRWVSNGFLLQEKHYVFWRNKILEKDAREPAILYTTCYDGWSETDRAAAVNNIYHIVLSRLIFLSLRLGVYLYHRRRITRTLARWLQHSIIRWRWVRPRLWIVSPAALSNRINRHRRLFRSCRMVIVCGFGFSPLRGGLQVIWLLMRNFLDSLSKWCGKWNQPFGKQSVRFRSGWNRGYGTFSGVDSARFVYQFAAVFA